MKYNKWKQISDDGYSSDAISILQFIKEEEELDREHMKTNSILSLLERKQLINGDKLTLLGEELLNNLELEELAPLKQKRVDKFEEWWKIYPATDGFIMDGKTFMGTQSKRIKKEVCKSLFKKIVNEGISEEDIISATKFHIDQAKKLSFKRGVSQISFIGNSYRYLNEKMFEPYIQSSKVVESKEMVNPDKLWN